MFSYAFSVVFKIIVEIETAVGRQFINSIDLAFAGLERGLNIIVRKILQLYPACAQSIPGQLLKPIIRQLARVFAIQPMQFVRIERGVTAHDLVQIEKRNYFFDWNFFAVVFWRPAEQAKVIADRLRQKAPLNIIVYARTLIALAHFW